MKKQNQMFYLFLSFGIQFVENRFQNEIYAVFPEESQSNFDRNETGKIILKEFLKNKVLLYC